MSWSYMTEENNLNLMKYFPTVKYKKNKPFLLRVSLSYLKQWNGETNLFFSKLGVYISKTTNNDLDL